MSRTAVGRKYTITCAPCGATFESDSRFALAVQAFALHRCRKTKPAVRPPMRLRLVSPAEIAARSTSTKTGSWTRAQLAQWGVPWPPPKGWRAALERKWKTCAKPLPRLRSLRHEYERKGLRGSPHRENGDG